jgi:ribosomal protein S11
MFANKKVGKLSSIKRTLLHKRNFPSKKRKTSKLFKKNASSNIKLKLQTKKALRLRMLLKRLKIRKKRSSFSRLPRIPGFVPKSYYKTVKTALLFKRIAFRRPKFLKAMLKIKIKKYSNAYKERLAHFLRLRKLRRRVLRKRRNKYKKQNKSYKRKSHLKHKKRPKRVVIPYATYLAYRTKLLSNPLLQSKQTYVNNKFQSKRILWLKKKRFGLFIKVYKHLHRVHTRWTLLKYRNIIKGRKKIIKKALHFLARIRRRIIRQRKKSIFKHVHKLKKLHKFKGLIKENYQRKFKDIIAHEYKGLPIIKKHGLFLVKINGKYLRINKSKLVKKKRWYERHVIQRIKRNKIKQFKKLSIKRVIAKVNNTLKQKLKIKRKNKPLLKIKRKVIKRRRKGRFLLKVRQGKNNVFVAATNLQSKPFFAVSCGITLMRGPRRSTPFAAELLGRHVAYKLNKRFRKKVGFIVLKTHMTKHIRSFLRGLSGGYRRFLAVLDLIPRPHGHGLRGRKVRRL